jgi:phage shock protein A
MRANLNDLIDKAEDPPKMLKQLILDMQNQLLQVKTQVAIAIADEHVLQKKHQENIDKHNEWMRKAELAVEKKQDDLARAAIDRAVASRKIAEGFEEEISHQKSQAENLKSSLKQLEQKLAEAQAKADLLVAKHRRSRALSKASEARIAAGDQAKMGTFDRMKNKIQGDEAMSHAMAELALDNLDEKLEALGKDDEVERLLAEIKSRKGVA